ncbi:hypothetical protein FOZ61_006481 [Perkinsus olseni]|uniref:Immunoglobulin super DCC subclass member n=1 Tax=Perkinsus olseni TaxID=32597 RepID=A0A7J6MA60_PEROL|nr:hypothetical protein FOZ61_006481 [Perkinsus olseni]
MRSFANSVLMTLLMVVDGTCNEAEKEKITGKLFPNFLYKCSLAAKLDTSAIAPCLEGPCQISFGPSHFEPFNLRMRSLVLFVVFAIVSANNACTDTDKQKIKSVSFSNFFHKCGADNRLSLGRIPSCLTTGCGLSAGCASCFGDVAQCGGIHCFFKCFFNNLAPACADCVTKNCQDAYFSCTGMTEPLTPATELSDKCL